MKKTLVFGVLLVMVMAGSAYALDEGKAQCCVLKKSEGTEGCSYWDMTGYDDAALNCRGIDAWTEGVIYHAYTEEYDNCADIPFETKYDWCVDPIDGLSIPEFSPIAAGLALAGASFGYLYIRRKRK